MSKQSTKGKLKIKDLYKPLVIFLLIQTLILVLFLLLYNTEVPIDIYTDCENSSIIVEDKYITKEGRRSSDEILHIISKGETYVFSESNYRAKELYEMISVGEEIDIFYIEKHNLFGEGYLFIVEARNDFEVFADVDKYNSDSSRVNSMLVILFGFSEIVFLVLAVFFAPFNLHDVNEKIKTFIDKYRKAKQTKQK